MLNNGAAAAPTLASLVFAARPGRPSARCDPRRHTCALGPELAHYAAQAGLV